jgi:hypothetical protein
MSRADPAAAPEDAVSHHPAPDEGPRATAANARRPRRAAWRWLPAAGLAAAGAAALWLLHGPGRDMPAPAAPAAETPGLRELVVGRWEGRNARGKKEGVEFAAGGAFKIAWEGMDSLPGTYRFVGADEVEVTFNPLYHFRAKVTVEGDTLTLAVAGGGGQKVTTYRRVRQPGARAAGEGGG